jgi:hypothetical protein
MIRRLLNYFRREAQAIRDWVDQREGRIQARPILLQSKDGSIPFLRLPSGQILSMKRLLRRARERGATAAPVTAPHHSSP